MLGTKLECVAVTGSWSRSHGSRTHVHAHTHTVKALLTSFSILCFFMRPLRSSFHAASPSSHLVLERRARPGKLICCRGSATSPPRLSFLSLHTFSSCTSTSHSRACPAAGHSRHNSDGRLVVCCQGRHSAPLTGRWFRAGPSRRKSNLQSNLQILLAAQC